MSHIIDYKKKNPDIAFTILPIRSFPEARICSFNYPSVDSFCSAATKKVKLIFPACLIDDQRDNSPALYQAIVEKYPDHRLAPSAQYNAAFAYLETGKLDEALTASKEFETKYAESDYLPDLLEVKADAHLLKKETAESQAVFQVEASRFKASIIKPSWPLSFNGSIRSFSANLSSETKAMGKK